MKLAGDLLKQAFADWQRHNAARLGLLRGRMWSFTMVLAVGFLLTVSLILSAALAAVDGLFERAGIFASLVHAIKCRGLVRRHHRTVRPDL